MYLIITIFTIYTILYYTVKIFFLDLQVESHGIKKNMCVDSSLYVSVFPGAV